MLLQLLAKNGGLYQCNHSGKPRNLYDDLSVESLLGSLIE